MVIRAHTFHCRSLSSSCRKVLATLVVRYAREHDAPAFADWCFALRNVQFHSCVHGGERAKDTRLRCTPAVFQELQASCDNSHKRAPWGIHRAMHGWSFDTSLEAQYPRKALQLDKLAALSNQKPVAPMLIPEFKSFTWVPDGQHAPKNARLVPHMLQSDCQVAPVPTWPVSLHSPSMPALQASPPPAVKHAWTMFASGFADMDSLWFLSTLLPAESYRPLPQGSASWLTGTQWFHGQCSPRPEVQEYTWCSHLLAQVFSTLAPDCVCTTLALFRELQAPLRRDTPEFYNVLVPLSTFQQGQVWVHHASGPALCPDASSQHHGILLDVASGPQLLDAARLHCTLPWQDRRLLLVGFTLQGWQDLSLAARSRLAAFPLPVKHSASAISPPRNILRGHEAGPGGSMHMDAGLARSVFGYAFAPCCLPTAC